jgi:PDZ domain-containing protein
MAVRDPSAPAEAPPLEVPPEPPEGQAQAQAFPVWGWWLSGLAIVVCVVVFAGFAIHVPYSTISPGEAVQIPPLITIDGAKTYTGDRGDLRLLFVRERNHVSLWRYLQAKLDPDTDLLRDVEVNPSNESPTQLEEESIQQMADAKTAATVVALEAAGYKVQRAPGLTVSGILTELPAAKYLRPGDVILAANGQTLEAQTDLGRIVKKHRVGDRIALNIQRDGKPLTVDVPVGFNQADGGKLLGVIASPRFHFPFTVNVNTAGIGGPSAGLAMSLAIFDELTPGNLTGGKRVAVTGTIDPEGNVGEIGGIQQKAVAARAAGARLFIVPRCSPDDPPPFLAGCQADLKRATQRAGHNVKVVPVSSFGQALQALRDNGGDVPTNVPASLAA